MSEHYDLIICNGTLIAGNCGISPAPLANSSPPSPLDLIDDGDAYRFRSSANFTALMKSEIPKWQAVIKRSGASMQ